MGVFQVQASGLGNVGCIDKDIQNYRRDKREAIKEKDAQFLYERLKQLQEMDPAFFFTIEKDLQYRITHVFWADPTFRNSYSDFGDVVTFDTTYMTNCYNLIFDAFVGLNHHGQSILFDCALLLNETFDSFVWFFNNWLQAMLGAPPKSIITDEDRAMTNAIKYVMPNTCHHFCLWHILEKLPVKVGGAAIYRQGFLKRLKHCIYNSQTQQQFEFNWKKMLEEFD